MFKKFILKFRLRKVEKKIESTKDTIFDKDIKFKQLGYEKKKLEENLKIQETVRSEILSVLGVPKNSESYATWSAQKLKVVANSK